MATLAQIRSGLATACASVTAQKYRFRPDNPEYPCVVIGWPTSFDVRANQDGGRDVEIPVSCGVEVKDPESADDELSALIESTITALSAAPTLGGIAYTIDIAPATDFGVEVIGDERRILWCALPVLVYA